MGFPTTTALRRLALATTAAAALIAAAPALAQPDPAPAQPVNIPEGPLDAALKTLAAQTRQQILYGPEVSDGRRAPAVSGRLTPEAALARLLGDQAVTITRAGPGVLVLKPRTPGAAPLAGPTASEAPQETARPFVGDPAAAPSSAPLAPAEPRTSNPAPHTVAELRVTGSHLRGAAGPAPVLTLTQEDLLATGHGTLAGAIQTLPQVFGGESTEGTLATRADFLGGNITFGSGVNLRGLGSDSTLTLIDGRRVTGSGLRSDFVDLSTLPTVAIERVEVLLDGASAIYGSDAVGGVVNIRLRRDYEGAEIRIRAGTATAGEPYEALIGAAFGRRWDTGGLMFAYEGQRRTELSAEDRPWTSDADLRPFGGADRRETWAFPGNILVRDPATGAMVPGYAIPAGQPGTGLTPASFLPGVVNRQTAHQGMDVLPDQRRHSAFLAVRQAMGDRLELSADVRYGFRKARTRLMPSISTLTVGRANPYFVSPTGASSHQIQYSFASDLGNGVAYRSAETFTATVGAELRLAGDWRAEGYAAFSTEIDESASSGLQNSVILNEALGNTPDNPATPFRAARDGYFNPFTGMAANPAAVIDAIRSGTNRNRPISEVLVANLQADGTLLEVPAGPVKLALGGQVRREAFDYTGSNFTSTATPVAQVALAGQRTVLAAFAEARLPLWSAAAPEAAPRVELSLAARGERYSDFGETFNPKVGLLVRPLEGLQLRGTWGTSFKAPAMRDLRQAASNTVLTVPDGARQVLALTLQGGNPDLQPETAESWTFGADYRPAFAPGLNLSATWFRTVFEDRVDRPLSGNTATALSDPRYEPFVRRIDPSANPADMALIQALLADPATRPAGNPPEAFGAVLDLRFVNTGRLAVEGVDVQASYRRPAFGGSLTLAANASRLLSYEEKLTPSAASSELVGVATHPPKLRGRVSADWSRSAWSAGLAVNRTSGFETLEGQAIDGQTTVDLQGRWRGAVRGVDLTLSVRNLFDAAPPFYDNPLGFAYDPASGDPVGRFVALQLTRSW